MSTRREDDSRPKGNVTSQRTTARDVPIAKYKEVPVGTAPPGALRGPSLLPGRGAPEKIIPEEVELAVLRNAETLDGPNVARAATKRHAEPSNSPSPMPVSVEVPRARSVHPLEEVATTPTSPSARSIQSGTLMSIGSIDPRAPTELSLPTPRPLSVSERAAYFGPEAVVDRSPLQPEIESRPVPSRQAVTERVNYPEPGSKPVPSRRPPAPPARRPLSSHPDTSAPPAQTFSQAPRSYSPPAPVSRPPRPAPRSQVEPSRLSSAGVSSMREAAPQFQIHSDLDAVPRELLEDSFDLRSAHTQREPLASRKPISIPDRAPPPDAQGLEPRSSRPSRHSTSAMTLMVERARDSLPPISEPAFARRAAVPVSWLIAAALGVLVALLAVWLLRAPAAQDTARVPDDRASASAPRVGPQLAPPSPRESIPGARVAPLAGGGASSPVFSTRSPGSSSAAKVGSGLPSARPPLPAASAAPDPSAKARQSIY
ncbi:MAG: hypothetical protein ABJB12_09785 [Pseudomonadota bacterium]